MVSILVQMRSVFIVMSIIFLQYLYHGAICYQDADSQCYEYQHLPDWEINTAFIASTPKNGFSKDLPNGYR